MKKHTSCKARRLAATALAAALAVSLSFPVAALATAEAEPSEVEQLAAAMDQGEAGAAPADTAEDAQLEAALQTAQAGQAAPEAASVSTQARDGEWLFEDIQLVEGEAQSYSQLLDDNIVSLKLHFTIEQNSRVLFYLPIISSVTKTHFALAGLFDSSGEVLDTFSVHSNSPDTEDHSWTLPAGEYYISLDIVHENFILTCGFMTDPTDDLQIFGPKSPTGDNVFPAEPNKPILGVHYDGAHDLPSWEADTLLYRHCSRSYEFTLTEASPVKFLFTTYGNASVVLYDANGDPIRNANGALIGCGTWRNDIDTIDSAIGDCGRLDPGTYQAVVISSGTDSAWNKPYILNIQVTPSWADFKDVSMGDWFVVEGEPESWLEYVVTRGLITGYRDPATEQPSGYFGPNDPITRGQVATILYRNEFPGSNVTSDPDVFKHQKNETKLTDNDDGQYYTAAVNWAYEQGIIKGDDNDAGKPLYTARPNDPVNRQELATMIARYAKSYGIDTTADPEVYASAPDAADVAPYASMTIAWCYANGILTGNSITGELMPEDPATRAQMAKMVTVLVRDVIPAAQA